MMTGYSDEMHWKKDEVDRSRGKVQWGVMQGRARVR